MAELNITKKDIEEMKCYLTQEREYYNRDARSYMGSQYPKDILAMEKALDMVYMVEKIMKLVLKYEEEINNNEQKWGLY